MFCGLQSSVMKINVRHQLSFSTTTFWQAAASRQILTLEGESLWSLDNAAKILGTLYTKGFGFQRDGPKVSPAPRAAVVALVLSP